MAFQQTINALEWCMEAQRKLIEVDWPEALLQHQGAAEEWGDVDDKVIFKVHSLAAGLKRKNGLAHLRI